MAACLTAAATAVAATTTAAAAKKTKGASKDAPLFFTYFDRILLLQWMVTLIML